LSSTRRGVTGQYNLLEIEGNIARKLPGALTLYKAFYRKMNLEILPVLAVDNVFIVR